MNASATGDVPRGTVVARGVARVAARGVARDGTRSRSTRAHHHLGSGFSNLFFRVVAASGRRDSPVVSATSSARIREYLSWPPAQILARPVGFFFLPRQPPVVRGLTRTPQTDGAHRTFASSSKHSRKAKSTLARRPARAPTARRVRGASSLVHRVVVPSLSCFARMALEDQRRRQPFRMAQGGPQVGPQGQSKTITVTITGACRARRAARAPAPEAGCHDSRAPRPARPRNKQP